MGSLLRQPASCVLQTCSDERGGGSTRCGAMVEAVVGSIGFACIGFLICLNHLTGDGWIWWYSYRRRRGDDEGGGVSI